MPTNILRFGSLGNMLNTTIRTGRYECQVEEHVDEADWFSIARASKELVDGAYILEEGTVVDLDVTHFELTGAPRLNAIAAKAFSECPNLKNLNILE